MKFEENVIQFCIRSIDLKSFSENPPFSGTNTLGGAIKRTWIVMRFKCSFTPLFTHKCEFPLSLSKIIADVSTFKYIQGCRNRKPNWFANYWREWEKKNFQFSKPNANIFSTFSRLFFFAPLCNCFRSLCFLLLWFTDNSNETSCMPLYFFSFSVREDAHVIIQAFKESHYLFVQGQLFATRTWGADVDA